jgi:pulcherriminic acid synthase
VTPEDHNVVYFDDSGCPAAKSEVLKGNRYRTFEIHQRRRVSEATSKVSPFQLTSPEFLVDPYSILAVLREDYPCYLDWVGNAYWVTRYDDVTSVFVDDPNYETRPKRWYYRLDDLGRDLRDELAVISCLAKHTDANAQVVAESLINAFVADGSANLATQFAARYPLELLTKTLDLPDADKGSDGRQAINELIAYFRPLLETRRANPGEDLISTVACLDLRAGPATAEDLVTTLLEADHETLHGALANLWYLLLTHPEQLAGVVSDRRRMKHAYYEMLRHSTPTLAARRHCRHEVERFGLLLPEGAMMICSAAAANRDPRIFDNPDQFIVERKDVCQREPRGMYRADGLAAGLAFGLGKPSQHPATPVDRPRSPYAITRDAAVAASNVLLDTLEDLRLAPGATPNLRCLSLGEMHTCWHLPVAFRSP